MQINLRSGFFPQRFGIRFEARQQASKGVVRGSVFALGLDAPGFGCRNIAGRGDDKVNVVFVGYFRADSFFNFYQIYVQLRKS